MKLSRSETALVGTWIFENKEIRGDEICNRIEWLTEHHLHKVAISPQCGGWETLFQDPDDGRYWERTYLQGEMHGGGPPCLRLLNTEHARAKYQL